MRFYISAVADHGAVSITYPGPIEAASMEEALDKFKEWLEGTMPFFGATEYLVSHDDLKAPVCIQP